MTDLAIHNQQTELQAMEPAPVNVGAIISEIMKRGIDPTAAASAIKELVQLQNNEQDRWSKREWAKAFAAVKAQTKTIQADKGVPRKNKQTEKMETAYYYVPLPELLDAIEPICQRNGLSISFDSKREGNIVTGTCIVTHSSGHPETRSCAKNIANAQGADPDLGAVTTCQRKALMLMFALRTEHMAEDDPRMLGEHITPEEAADLEARCMALGSAKYTAALLKYLNAETFGDVYTAALPKAEAALRKAESDREKFQKNFSGNRSTGADAHSANPSGAAASPTSPPSAPVTDLNALQNQADAFANETPLPVLQSYLMKLSQAARATAMQSANIATIVDAKEGEVRAVSYFAKLSELTRICRWNAAM